jgi:hypothetical protein
MPVGQNTFDQKTWHQKNFLIENAETQKVVVLNPPPPSLSDLPQFAPQTGELDCWRHDTQHYDIQHNDTQDRGLSDIKHNEIQLNKIQHNET